MQSGIHMLKRMPAGLPFTMRTGKAKAALLMLAVAVIVEPVFLAITAMDPEITEALGSGGAQVVVVAILVLCWLVLAFRRATFGLSDAGVWIRLGTSPHMVYLPWSQIERVEPVRFFLLTSLGFTLRDPKILESTEVRKVASRRAVKAMGEATEQASGTVPASHLQVWLSTANRSVPEVAQALARFAPADVELNLPTDVAERGRGARMVGRILLAIGWIGLFTVGTSALAWALFDLGPDTAMGKIIAFASAAAGGATMPRVFRQYERIIDRRPSTQDRLPPV
jgi:hypothetical protein